MGVQKKKCDPGKHLYVQTGERREHIPSKGYREKKKCLNCNHERWVAVRPDPLPIDLEKLK